MKVQPHKNHQLEEVSSLDSIYLVVLNNNFHAAVSSIYVCLHDLFYECLLLHGAVYRRMGRPLS